MFIQERTSFYSRNQSRCDDSESQDSLEPDTSHEYSNLYTTQQIEEELQ